MMRPFRDIETRSYQAGHIVIRRALFRYVVEWFPRHRMLGISRYRKQQWSFWTFDAAYNMFGDIARETYLRCADTRFSED